MFWRKRDKERDRYYLLPGQGGRAHKRKQVMMLKWSITIGLLISVVVALILYLLNTSGN